MLVAAFWSMSATAASVAFGTFSWMFFACTRPIAPAPTRPNPIF